MNGANAIEVKKVSKSFKVETVVAGKKGLISKKSTVKSEKKVLDGISFNVRKGEIVGILGRNGSGKSTLLSMLAGILEPDQGEIERSGSVASILELGMGFDPDASGRENVYLKGELYGMSKKDINDIIDEIIDYAGIREYIDNPVRTYSSGMRGRLAFSIMTHVSADIMLVDEVLSVGDSVFSTKSKEHFKKMAQTGKTFLIVSHRMSFIESVCTRAIWIDNGKIRQDGPSKKICADYTNAMNESPEIILDLANEGVSESQYTLAHMFLDGGPFGKDESLYLKWLESAARQGHTRAQVEFGEILVQEGNDSEALYFFQSAAAKGDNDAKARLASTGGTEDPVIAEALEVLKEAAEKGNAVQKFRYGDMLLKTALTQNDRKKAFSVFQESADMGHPNAMHQVAMMCKDGIGTAKDLPKMEKYLVKASDAGFINSMVMLSDMYNQGKVLHNNDERSFNYALKAAKLGNTNMMYRVACCFRDGLGCSINTEESERWFKIYRHSMLFSNKMQAIDEAKTGTGKHDLNGLYNSATITPNIQSSYNSLLHNAVMGREVKDDLKDIEAFADCGNIDAMKKAGGVYYSGIGAKKDFGQALKWYKMAADLDDSWSKNKVGEMLRDGEGTEIDLSEACKMFMEAGRLGNVAGLWNIVIMHSTGTINDKGLYMDAVNAMSSIADSGNVDALKRMGNIYYDGFGSKRNYSDAFKWYEKAARLGDQWSKQKVAEMYRAGKGVKRDAKKAAEWFVARS